MIIDFVPSISVAISLIACGLVPAMLVAFSHGPLRIAAPGRRFLLAAGATWAMWLAVELSLSPGAVDLVTSMLLLATATLVGFTLWTLIAWGFTLSMLLALARADRTLTAEEWAKIYTRGKPLDVFARDRIGVLLRLRLAESCEERIAMTRRRGWAFARFVVVLRKFFGLPQ